MTAADLFSEEQRETIRRAVEAAERRTSGEIRVHIEKQCNDDAMSCAKKRFLQLGMQRTKERNGVLFYLAVESRVFAIVGDEGIDRKVPADFWNSISATMEEKFRAGKFTEGLAEGIATAGEQLEKHFPRATDDKDELTNEISFE